MKYTLAAMVKGPFRKIRRSSSGDSSVNSTYTHDARDAAETANNTTTLGAPQPSAGARVRASKTAEKPTPARMKPFKSNFRASTLSVSRSHSDVRMMAAIPIGTLMKKTILQLEVSTR